MRARTHARLLGLLLCVGLPLFGCEVRTLDVWIPDFDPSGVSAIGVFRLDDTTSVATDAGAVVFDALVVQPDGTETIDYHVVQPSGVAEGPFPAFVVRDPNQPGGARVNVFFHSVTPSGWYRVNSRNQYGDSALSSEQTWLM